MKSCRGADKLDSGKPLSSFGKDLLPAQVSGRIRKKVFVIVLGLAIGFAIFTGHAWEDYYITYRASKNLATGAGLVYTPGERTHTFTSPLGVLIPALLSFITRNFSDTLVLWLFRVVSAAGFATAVILLLRIAPHVAMNRISAAFLIGMLAIDAKSLDFSINGMETGILLLFLALTLDAMIIPSRHPAWKIGLAWAGLMWTRPDSFVYIAGLCGGFLLFRAGPGGDRKSLLKLYASAGFIAAVLYLPWLGWTWHYYGSPIPNTVVAKGLRTNKAPLDLLLSFPFYPLLSLFLPGTCASAFLPPYALLGGWPGWLGIWSRVLGWSSLIIWIFPKAKPVYRAASIAILLGGFYLDVIAPFPYPWYLPAWTLLSVFVLAGIFNSWLEWSFDSRGARADLERFYSLRRGLPVAILSMTLVISFGLTLAAAYELRVQQAVIEAGNRKQIGLWLAAHAASKSDTVFLEPVGYIGFFSQLKMLDFPGLCSREVIGARKKLGSDGTAGLVRELKPDWLVLRTAEVERISSNAPTLLTSDYEPVRTFDVSDRVRSYRFLPGRDWLMVDQAFVVFRHRR